MGRRGFGISVTQINRLIASSNAAKKARERDQLIKSQEGLSREQEPKYEINAFDFNEISRIAHIDFLEKVFYRKIDRYVTQNGQKHPIYSDWQLKTKTIKKVIKLTNEKLESLQGDDDFLVNMFCYEIISKLDNDELYPSWFIKDTLTNEKEDEIRKVSNIYSDKNKIENNFISKCNIEIENADAQLFELNKQLQEIDNKLIKKNKSLKKAKDKSFYVVLMIITFGLYYFSHSKKRISKLNIDIESLEKNKHDIENSISDNRIIIRESDKKIKQSKERINSTILEKKEQVLIVERKYDEMISKIEPLPTSLDNSIESDFIPLKKLSGMNYEKVVGCYVIHNVETNKYYVGQSKDVMKRVCKQHFDGTKVKNIIFAEDYYKSSFENKDDLFEVKIIRLDTKDELDRKEKELIEEYDSFNTGYNGTSGNK